MQKRNRYNWLHTSNIIATSINYSTYVADSIEATHDAWFLGDSFLRDVYNGLQALLNKAKLDRKATKPYLHEYYNTKGYYYSSSYIQSAISRMLNKLIEALNENDRLPRHLIVLMDKDIINDLQNFEFGATKNLANMVNWLTRQIDIFIRRKRLQIMEKKPGAVTGNNPKVIYVTMIRHQERFSRSSRMASICTFRRKFNEMLNEAAARENAYVMNLHACTTLDHFDRQGNLSSWGKSAFWYEVDDTIERFDRRDPKYKLLPQSRAEAKFQQ